MDEAFADCSIPQEKSNADINAELGISDADEDDSLLNQKGSEYKHITVSQESSFKRIDANEFLHRSRKNQNIDEIMVCHCRPPQDGWLGCGDQCLNRMLNIECVQGTCPCGDICSNQQFQKQEYAGMKWVRCGKKGFGLQLQQDISKGQFLIEYVGEVLDMHAYEARQREYAAKGHKHFYFMTLNGSEVIDACAKGNLGRFINHSCDPNCRTEKWMVNGEICIGLFALRDIKKGEELTFDYNYVRVFGAAVKKCYCGSPQCRGYIGGDPHNAEVIVQGDSDEEFPEPMMLEDVKTGVHLKDTNLRTNSFGNEDMKSVEVPIVSSEMTTEIGDAINLSASVTSQPHSSLEPEASKRKSPCSSHPVEVSSQTISATKSTSHVREPTPPENTLCSVQVLEKSFSVDVDASRKSKSETVKGKRVFSKSRFLIKNSHSCGSLKKGKVNGNLANENKVQMIANKPHVLSVRTKKLVEGSSDGHFEAVEEKLNELLDVNGGISKRKEAPKGYLKLLLLTAASGGSGNGEAIQSNRDLSMILDALLKTKSRVVLVDIINKNGLRMLHNIMKQYRRDFKKIPILRKLLKVLEYLATREILAFDHINGGPPCPGMESFRESMLSLTEHDDKQVHQIARHFRDRWIPKFVRKANSLDRDDGGMEFHRGSSCGSVSVSHNHWRDDAVRSIKAIDCVMQSVPVTTSVDGTVQKGSFESSAGGCKTNGAKTQKRKSRWDQPSMPKTNVRSSISPNVGEVDHLEQVSREDNSCLEYIQRQCLQNEVICSANGRINSPVDVPPGFSFPLNPTLVSSSTSITPQSVVRLNCPVEVVVGHSQGKFISRLPVAYGIPLPIVQQIGSPDNERLESWVIAPGMPFRPFPPLPPYPRDTKSTPHCVVKSTATNEQAQGHKDSLDTSCYPHEKNHTTIFPRQSEANLQVANVQETCKRARGSSYDLEKKYYRQQNWNKVPPWLRRGQWGYAGNNLRGGICSVDVGNVTNESRSPYCTQDVNHGVEKAGCYYNPHLHPHLHHQNQH
ncbi:histone-lysine N-methyltransferase ASHH2 [Tripterygium wilfordii]|uniref:Histone-lysine N-methyltransferase ASHH2 n=2 Tax=Tripterygium wilfordii TaxID=458696 RepID=A0A7J7CN18_TRIWF|nr:histone-lysine N-methyltransferase ASHH2 [Tripterygium wilfordii]